MTVRPLGGQRAGRKLPTKHRDSLMCYKASTYGSNGRHSGIVDHFHWQSRLAMTHRTEENNSA